MSAPEDAVRRPLASALAALAVSATWTASAVGLAAPAHAEERAQRFDIPAQRLSTALLEFARQAQLEVFLPEAPLVGARSTEVRGVYEPSAALSRLLQGTGFEGSIRDGVIRLRRAAERRPPPRDQRTRLRPRSPEPELSETVVVVGTNIRGLYPGAYPVDIYTADDIARTGAVRTEQFIGTLTQNLDTRTQNGPGSAAATNREGVNGIDLRGLGVGASLVLVNGRRLPLASEGRTADLSFIPPSALDRIEVLTDGASAIYGSDAIGGVVNLVLKRSAEHVETRIDYGGVTQGGLRAGGMSHGMGATWEHGAGFLSMSARRASALERMDRAFAADAGRGDLSPDDERYALVGSLSLDLSERLSVAGDIVAGMREVKSEFEFPELQVFLTGKTETEHLFANFHGDYEISDRLSASLLVTYSDRADTVEQRALSLAGAGAINPDTAYSSLDVTAKIDGRLGMLPGGAMRFSLGGGRLTEQFWSRLSGYDLGQTTNYLFVEAFAPIIGEAQAVPLARRLELSLAARYTDYADESEPPLENDFGDQISPKLGLLWAPTDWLSLRASFSQSFRAPALIDLDPNTAVNSLVVLPVRGVPTVVLGVFGPSPGIEPETAETLTAGFDLSAPFDPRFRVRATYFNVAYNGRVATPDPTMGLAPFTDPDSYPDILFAMQSAALIEEILASSTNTVNATQIDLSSATGAAAQLAALSNFVVFDNRLRNLDEVRLDGVDLDLSYDREFTWGEARLGARFTYMMDYAERISPNAPIVTVVDTVLRPVDLRGRAYVEIDRDALSLMLAFNYVDDYRNPYGLGETRVDSWATWDARVTIDFNANQDGSRGASLTLSVQNLFDEAPPFAATSGIQGQALRAPIGFDPANADPIGRFVTVELSKRW